MGGRAGTRAPAEAGPAVGQGQPTGKEMPPRPTGVPVRESWRSSPRISPGHTRRVPLIPGCYFLRLLRPEGPEGRPVGREGAARSHPRANPVSASPGRMLLHSPGCYCQEMGFPELIKGLLSFLQDQPPFSSVPSQH